MSTTKIAVRYATPLLELAEEQNILEKVHADLSNFISLCKESRDLSLMLSSPIISNLKKADILSKIFKGRVNDLTSNFFQLVAKKGRENILPEIAEEFIKIYNEKKGLQEATVITTVALDDVTRAAFSKLVTDVTGKKAILKEKIDKDLIGGYIVKLGDRQIDDSVGGKLKDLKIRFQKENI
jgi:F-type H+-transporting ATPase subunit delta